jgi:dihydropteroate synthase
MEEAGADVIDVGAESTRPGAQMTSARDEIERLKPVLKKIIEGVHLPVSLDTYKAEVARYAIDCGASVINDISGLRSDRAMAKLLAGCDAGVILMHIKGEPRTMQDNPVYDNLMEELHQYFRERLAFVAEQGIDLDRVAIDPGLGFGKRLEDNYTIIRRLREFSVFARPILAGPSRKSFVGVPFGLPPEERLEGTLGLAAILIEQGCNVLRVHDVSQTRRVSQLIDLVMGNRRNGG